MEGRSSRTSPHTPGRLPPCLAVLTCLLACGCGPATSINRSDANLSQGGRGGGGAGGGGTIGSGGVGGQGGAGGGVGDGGSGGGAPGGTGGGPGTDAAADLALPPDAALPDLAPPVDLAPRPDANQGPPELSRGRVGHWKLDEGRGNVGLDSSGIGNHGGTVNILGPDWRMGRIGTALAFTGPRRTFMIVPSHPTIGPTEALSISVWVNAAGWEGAPRILQKAEDDSQYSLRAEGGQLRFVLRLTEVAMVATALPPTGRWVHIGATYDGQELRLYVDGSPVAMFAATGPVASPFASLNIGTRSQAAAETDFFTGLIDDIIIYERALSAAEVRLLSEAKSP